MIVKQRQSSHVLVPQILLDQVQKKAKSQNICSYAQVIFFNGFVFMTSKNVSLLMT